MYIIISLQGKVDVISLIKDTYSDSNKEKDLITHIAMRHFSFNTICLSLSIAKKIVRKHSLYNYKMLVIRKIKSVDYEFVSAIMNLHNIWRTFTKEIIHISNHTNSHFHSEFILSQTRTSLQYCFITWNVGSVLFIYVGSMLLCHEI